MCIHRRPTVGCATRGSVAPSTAFGGGVAPGVTPHLVAEVDGGEKYTTRPVVSQPGGRGGGGVGTWMGGTPGAPPLDIVLVTSSI